MKFFGGKESVNVRSVGATRAVIDQTAEIEKVEIIFENDEGRKLSMMLTAKQAATLWHNLADAYEAINPPLKRGTKYAEYLGMKDHQ